MKKKTYWLLAAAMTMAGCASDSDLNGGNDSAAEAAVAVSATRAASTTEAESLAEGETFRLINKTRQEKGKTTKCDAVYMVGADGKALPQNATDYVVWQTGIYGQGFHITQNEFQAVIPATASYQSYTLPTDQSDAGKLKAADWQTAACYHNLANAADGITLNFEHQYAKLHFDVTLKGDAQDATITDIKVLGSITPYKNENTIEAIISPTQTSTEPTPSLIELEIAGETLTAPLPDDITFESGKQYNFTLVVGHNAATISAVTVSEWTTSGIYTEDEAVKKPEIPYLTFSAESEQTFRMLWISSSFGDNFEYSIGNGEWKKISTINSNSPVPFGGTHGNLRLRGKNEKGTADGIGSCNRIYFNNDGGDVSCTGDIRTLIDYENYKTAETKYAKFCKLFYECKVLTSAPKLPATNLAEECYYNMFTNCVKLKEAPELPATKLTNQCYRAMFEGCTSLTKAPDIKPQTVATECCYSMFQGCSNLTEASKTLPAMVLAVCCYQSMFSNCQALMKAPKLPAETLNDNCYINMFYGCSSLTEAPELPANELTNGCYYGMFKGCTSLVYAPELPATELANACYQEMFYNCTALTNVQERLPAETLTEKCYYKMFYGCESMTTAPELPAKTLGTNCYESMFYNCKALKNVTMLTEASNIKESYFNYWLYFTAEGDTPPTLTLHSKEVYEKLKTSSNYLPAKWRSKSDGGNATIEYKNN